MIWCHFETGGEANYCIVEGGRVIQVSESPLDECAVTNNIHSLEQVKLLAPIKSGMLYSAGLNYRGYQNVIRDHRLWTSFQIDTDKDPSARMAHLRLRG
jgi:hypothetical protein